MEELKINLNTLWSSSDSELPEWILSTHNCIYRIHNLVNGKNYIGQTKNFYIRLVQYNYLSHKRSYYEGDERVLYRALRKYGLGNFEVIIEQITEDPNKLNELENYYIIKYNSYIHFSKSNGYNMTTGGDNNEQLNTEESIRKRVNTQYSRYGRMPWNDPEVHKRALVTQRANNGGVLPYNDPKLVERLTKERGGDFMKHCHTPEVVKLRIESDKANHGGVMGMHTPRAVETRNKVLRSSEVVSSRLSNDRANHGGRLGMHDPEVLKRSLHNSRLSKIINAIGRKIEIIKSSG